LDEIKTGRSQFIVLEDIHGVSVGKKDLYPGTVLADRLSDLFTVLLRHDHIEQDEANPFPVFQELGDGFFTVLRSDHLIVEGFQSDSDQCPQLRVILGDEDGLMAALLQSNRRLL